MVPADDEILAAEYMRYQAVLARGAPGVAVLEPDGVKLTVADWNVAHPNNPRGPNGRFIRGGGGVPSAPAAPDADGLDDLDTRDLRDLALEHGMNPDRDRDLVIADLRAAGAVAPSVTRAAQAAQATPPFAIRPGLADLRTRAEVERYLRNGLTHALGRDVPVDLGNRLPLGTARELSEGLLRAAERWPNANLVRVDVVGSRQLLGPAPDAWSFTRWGPGGMQIQFNQTQLANRQHFLRQLQRTIDAGDHRPTAANNGAAYVAAHEFGRVVEASLPQPSQHNSARMRVAAEHIQSAGVDLDDPSAVQDYFRQHLGGYAVHSTPAAVAEAFADVELNGEDGASPLSVAIVKQMRVDHDALPAGSNAPGAGRHRAPAQPPLPATGASTTSSRPLTEDDKKIGALIPTSWNEWGTRRDEIEQIVREQIDGEYAGLQVRLEKVAGDENTLQFDAKILDSNGRSVGTTIRQFSRNRNGTLSVYHALMTLDRRVQGQGFAEAWNGRLMRWYSESGLDRITVSANIDVGGYTWARQGFDFASVSDANVIRGRLREHMQLITRNYDADQKAAVADVLLRMDQVPFGSPGYPTAYEVSQAGRKPGQGKDDPWPGKMAMLGSYWHGVKPVPAPTPAS